MFKWEGSLDNFMNKFTSEKLKVLTKNQETNIY